MKYYIFVLLFLVLISGCTVFTPVDKENDVDVSEFFKKLESAEQEKDASNSKPESITIPESMMQTLTFETPTKIQDTTEPQDVVVDVVVGITGGMGPALLEYAQKEKEKEVVLEYPAYLNQDDLDKVLVAGGGLSACYVGTPKVRMAANITLVKKTETNYSIEPVEVDESKTRALMSTFYEAQVNTVYDVLIQVEGC